MVYKVSLEREETLRGINANTSFSTGIPLRRKISSLASAPSKEIGKSKSSSLKMTDGVPFITMVFRSMQAARTLSATRTMAASFTSPRKISSNLFKHGDGVPLESLGMVGGLIVAGGQRKGRVTGEF